MSYRDTKEDIEKCLSCKRKECNNCLEHKPISFDEKLWAKPRLKENPRQGAESLNEVYVWIEPTSEEEWIILDRYWEGWLDKEIAAYLNRSAPFVFQHRLRLGLPSISARDALMRKCIVQSWLGTNPAEGRR